MKNINFFAAILTIGFLLSGCGDSGSNTRRTVTTPRNGSSSASTTVTLKSDNNTKGNVSYIDFRVILPSRTTQSLFDYAGEATLKGTIQATDLPCIKERSSFNCKATLSSGSITAQNCSIKNNSIYIHITLLRGQKLKESYSVYYAKAKAPFSCHLPQK